MAEKTKKAKVNLEGVIINHRIQTEAIFKVRLDVSHIKRLTVYETLIDRLRNLLTTIDNVWSEYARERNITHKDFLIRDSNMVKTRELRNTVEFVVIPQTIVNSIKYIRTLTYEVINKYSLKIPLSEQEVESEDKEKRRGRRVKYLYIVPKSLFPKFMKEIEEINRRVEEINTVRGRISQKLREDEIGKYSLLDYFSSPYWEELSNLIISVQVLNGLGKNLKSLSSAEIAAILNGIMQGERIDDVVAEVVKDEGVRSKVLEIYRTAVNNLARDVPHRFNPVNITPLFIDLTPKELDRWAREDPELSRQLRENAKNIINSMVRQFADEIKELLTKVKEKAPILIRRGAAPWVMEEIEAINMKLEAIGLGRMEELESLVDILKKPQGVKQEDIHSAISGALEKIELMEMEHVAAPEAAEVMVENEYIGGLEEAENDFEI